jgi:hypothetical protein
MSAEESRGTKKGDSLNHLGCNSCAYFYITWDKRYPYGCRAMSFISSNLPSIDVFEVEGRDCLAFESRESSHKNSRICLRKNGGENKKINVIV